jgi:hypothetical protein
MIFFGNAIAIEFTQISTKAMLYQNTKWRSHFVFLKPLLGLVFNTQKWCHPFVNWCYSALHPNQKRVATLLTATLFWFG